MNYESTYWEPSNPADIDDTPDAPRPDPVCSWCMEWSDLRAHCTLRAKADLEQLPKTHAQNCHFYVEECPF